MPRRKKNPGPHPTGLDGLAVALGATVQPLVNAAVSATVADHMIAWLSANAPDKLAAAAAHRSLEAPQHTPVPAILPEPREDNVTTSIAPRAPVSAPPRLNSDRKKNGSSGTAVVVDPTASASE